MSEVAQLIEQGLKSADPNVRAQAERWQEFGRAGRALEAARAALASAQQEGIAPNVTATRILDGALADYARVKAVEEKAISASQARIDSAQAAVASAEKEKDRVVSEWAARLDALRADVAKAEQAERDASAALGIKV